MHYFPFPLYLCRKIAPRRQSTRPPTKTPLSVSILLSISPVLLSQTCAVTSTHAAPDEGHPQCKHSIFCFPCTSVTKLRRDGGARDPDENPLRLRAILCFVPLYFCRKIAPRRRHWQPRRRHPRLKAILFFVPSTSVAKLHRDGSGGGLKPNVSSLVFGTAHMYEHLS